MGFVFSCCLYIYLNSLDGDWHFGPEITLLVFLAADALTIFSTYAYLSGVAQ